jgi:hypothetical protein
VEGFGGLPFKKTHVFESSLCYTWYWGFAQYKIQVYMERVF